MIEFFIYIIIVIISNFIYSFIFSMIILSIFFGIPQTIKLKKEKILLETASIKPYLITSTLWCCFIFIIIIFLFNILRKEYFVAVIFGMFIAFFNSLKSLSKDNYKTNMEELLKIQSNHLNPEFVNFVNNGVENVYLEKANTIAKLRGFNSWNELEEIFIKENNINDDINQLTIEEKLNYIANYNGYNDFNDLYNACVEESKSTKN